MQEFKNVYLVLFSYYTRVTIYLATRKILCPKILYKNLLYRQYKLLIKQEL